MWKGLYIEECEESHTHLSGMPSQGGDLFQCPGAENDDQLRLQFGIPKEMLLTSRPCLGGRNSFGLIWIPKVHVKTRPAGPMRTGNLHFALALSITLTDWWVRWARTSVAILTATLAPLLSTWLSTWLATWLSTLIFAISFSFAFGFALPSVSITFLALFALLGSFGFFRLFQVKERISSLLRGLPSTIFGCKLFVKFSFHVFPHLLRCGGANLG